MPVMIGSSCWSISSTRCVGFVLWAKLVGSCFAMRVGQNASYFSLRPMMNRSHIIITAKVSKKVSNGDSKFFELKTFSYKPRTHTAADHDFSDAKRIVHDTKQSLKVAEAMDEEFGRTYMPESIAALLRETEVRPPASA